MSGGWERLATLAESELALARAGRWDELPDAVQARAAAAALLGPPPLAAAGALERTVAAHRELIALLEAGRSETAAELARLRQGRTAVRGYGAARSAARSLAAG